jgi:hypothetical protein
MIPAASSSILSSIDSGLIVGWHLIRPSLSVVRRRCRSVNLHSPVLLRAGSHFFFRLRTGRERTDQSWPLRLSHALHLRLLCSLPRRMSLDGVLDHASDQASARTTAKSAAPAVSIAAAASRSVAIAISGSAATSALSTACAGARCVVVGGSGGACASGALVGAAHNEGWDWWKEICRCGDFMC